MACFDHLPWILAISCIFLLPLCSCADFGEACNGSNPCTDELTCLATTNKCACTPPFKFIDGKCRDTLYGGLCNSSADCPAGAECFNYTSGRPDDSSRFICIATANAIKDVQVNQFLDESMKPVLNITWVAGTYTGPIVFLISVRGKDYFDTSTNFDVSYATFQYPTELEQSDGVYGGWRYEISVLAKTGVGNGPEYKLRDLVTAIDGKPGLVRNVQAQQSSSFAYEMKLSFECPDSKERNGIITAFIIRKTVVTDGSNVSSEYTFPQDFTSSDCMIDLKASQVGGVEVSNNYTFEVKVQNAKYEGNFSSPVHMYTHARKPYPSTANDPDKLLSSDKGKAEKTLPTSFDVKLCSSCFLDPIQGPIKSVAMVICAESSKDCQNNIYRNYDDPSDINKFSTWAEARAVNFSIPYRTTPSLWHDTLARYKSDSFVFKVGAEDNCDEKNMVDFCNGPLPQDKQFQVTVVVCNDAGCDGTISYDGQFNTKAEERDDDDDDNDHLVIGLAVGLGVVSFICFCLIVYIVTRRSRSMTI